MAEKIRYPVEYNPILEYWEQILDKKVNVSDKVYRTYKKVVDDIRHPGEYYYSPKITYWNLQRITVDIPKENLVGSRYG